MSISHLKKYLFFSVVAIKMMYFLAFTKELLDHILSSPVTFRLSPLINNVIKVTASSDNKVMAKRFRILPSLSDKRRMHKPVSNKR